MFHGSRPLCILTLASDDTDNIRLSFFTTILSHMHKFSLELAAGLLTLIAGISATKNGVTIERLGSEVQTVAGAYATKNGIIGWLCIGLASVLLSLALRRWMQVNGHRTWEVILWPLVLTVVLLLGSCSLIGRSSSPIVETHHSADTSTVETLHSDTIPGQMLPGARKKNALLNGANLQRAMLAGADLRGSDLQSADLRSAMLLGANLSRANLTNANLEGAMLLGTHMEGARIDGADFTKAAFLTQDQVDEACGKPNALPEGLRPPQPC